MESLCVQNGHLNYGQETIKWTTGVETQILKHPKILKNKKKKNLNFLFF